MDFSVIIPVYNDKQHIVSCVDHLLCNQLMIDIEVIIVDDGSTDGIDNVIIELQKKYSCIVYLKRIHQGLSAARNAGLKCATGKYVFFVDSDDIPESSVLTKAWNVCEEHDLDVLFFSFDSFADTEQMKDKYLKHIIQVKRKANYENSVMTGVELHKKFVEEKEYYPVVWIQVVRKTFLEINSIYFREELIYEDNYYTFCILMKAKRAMCINEILYHKRIREGSITTQSETAHSVYSFLKTLILILNLFEKDVSHKNFYSVIRRIRNIQSCYEITITDLVKQIIKRYKRLTSIEIERLVELCSDEEYSILEVLLNQISVIIPLYNNDEYISDCVKSVQNQTVINLEIIVIDDGSIDNSAEIVKRLEKLDNRIKYYHQQNGGSASARNAGLKVANGKYVAFLDSDDYYVDADALEYMLISCIDYKCLLCGSYRIENRNGTIVCEDHYCDLGDIPPEGKCFLFSEYQNDFFFQRYIFSREIFNKTGIEFPNYRRYEDPVFLSRVMAHSKKFYIVPKVLHCYRKGHQNYQENGKFIVENLKGLRDVLVIAERNGYSKLFDLTIERINYMFLNDILNNYSQEVEALLKEINGIYKHYNNCNSDIPFISSNSIFSKITE